MEESSFALITDILIKLIKILNKYCIFPLQTIFHYNTIYPLFQAIIIIIIIIIPELITYSLQFLILNHNLFE